MTNTAASRVAVDDRRSSLIPAPLQPRRRPMSTSRIPAFPPATRRRRDAWKLYAISSRAQVALQEINQALAELQALENPFSQNDPITPIQLGHWEQQAQARRALRRKRAMPDMAAELRQEVPNEHSEQADIISEVEERLPNEGLSLQPRAATGPEDSSSLGLLTALKLTPPSDRDTLQRATESPYLKPKAAADFTTFCAPKSTSQRRLGAKKHVPPSLGIAPQSSLAVMPVLESKSTEVLRIDSPQAAPMDKTNNKPSMPIDVAAELEVLKRDKEAEEEIAAAQHAYVPPPGRVSRFVADLRYEPGKTQRTTPVIDAEAELKMLSQDLVGEAMVDLAKHQLASVSKAKGGVTQGQYMLSPLDLGTPWGGFRF